MRGSISREQSCCLVMSEQGLKEEKKDQAGEMFRRAASL